MSIQKIDDYNYNLQFLIQQYKDKEKFRKIIEAMNAKANDLETAQFEIRDNFTIDTAKGVQLDIIGEILGLERDGRDDESYRTLLKVKAEINKSAATPEALIKTATALYNATDVQYVPIYPAKVQLWTDGDIGVYLMFDMELDDGGLMELDDGGILELQQPDEIAEDLLFEVLPSGVGLILADTLILDDDGFLYLDDGGFMILSPS